MTTLKYIFIDFDGVLHGKKFNKDLFCHSKLLCERLFKYKDKFRIVVSSSWREEYDFEVLVSAFKEEYSLEDIVIDSTPVFKSGYNDGGRYLEIQAYCDQHNISSTQWIAIDDMARLFPANCPNLILVDTATGIDEAAMNKIENFLKK